METDVDDNYKYFLHPHYMTKPLTLAKISSVNFESSL